MTVTKPGKDLLELSQELENKQVHYYIKKNELSMFEYITELNKQIKIINQFRELFYALKYKKKFKNLKTGKVEHMHSDARAYAIEFGTVRWLKGEGRPFIRPALELNHQVVNDGLAVSLRNALLKYKSKQMNTK